MQNNVDRQRTRAKHNSTSEKDATTVIFTSTVDFIYYIADTRVFFPFKVGISSGLNQEM